MSEWVHRWVTVARAKWFTSDTEYLPNTRFLTPASYSVFGKDDAFWAKIERLAPHKISIYDDVFKEHIDWIVEYGVGIWAIRVSRMRFISTLPSDPEFRQVVYFSDKNDAFQFRLQFPCGVGDKPRG
ncbi:MAG: hypothetical protein EOP83_01385 [Verrucomicrobiaceae bacterium]|nr:MAG: hypothetical protein EOP83_01385 [Verrucomicrobiaceae bacterium]